MRILIYYAITILVNLCFFTLAKAQNNPFQSPINTIKKPWSNLDFYNDPNNFQFAIVTDRTGGHRKGVFARAVEKINTLMPEFVMSVGDLVEGTNDTTVLAEQWSEFNQMIGNLKIPFFYLPGNHDVNRGAGPKRDYWNQLFGHAYYHYVYKDVLFLAMDSNEGQGEQFSSEQLNYFKQALDENKNVRWTLVFMHHPLWTYEHDSNFEALEELLKDRKYTIFAGHQHTYRHFQRNNTNYYILATTGGGSSLRGPSFGQFDHITWVTMTQNGPVLANLKLDGILPHDVASPELVALSRELVKSTAFEYTILLPDSEKPEKGVAQITIRNSAELPLSFSSKFYHNHLVTPSKVSIEETIPAKSEKKIVLHLEDIYHVDFEDKIRLDLDWVISFDNQSAPGLNLSGNLPLFIEPSKLEIIQEEFIQFSDTYELALKAPLEGASIFYTLDGSEPSAGSSVYSQPFTVQENTTIKAKVITSEGYASVTDMVQFEKVKAEKGLMCFYYEYDGTTARWSKLPDFSEIRPTKVLAVDNIDPSNVADQRYYFATVYKGNFNVPKAGLYKFSTNSDDGSLLLVDGKKVVDNDGRHGVRVVDGSIELTKGKHALEIQYFQDRSGQVLEVWYEGPGIPKKALPVATFTF